MDGLVGGARGPGCMGHLRQRGSARGTREPSSSWHDEACVFVEKTRTCKAGQARCPGRRVACARVCKHAWHHITSHHLRWWTCGAGLPSRCRRRPSRTLLQGCDDDVHNGKKHDSVQRHQIQAHAHVPDSSVEKRACTTGDPGVGEAVRPSQPVTRQCMHFRTSIDSHGKLAYG